MTINQPKWKTYGLTNIYTINNIHSPPAPPEAGYPKNYMDREKRYKK
jgi:hypothetical protein